MIVTYSLDGEILEVKENQSSTNYENACKSFARATINQWQEVLDGIQKPNHYEDDSKETA